VLAYTTSELGGSIARATIRRCGRPTPVQCSPLSLRRDQGPDSVVSSARMGVATCPGVAGIAAPDIPAKPGAELGGELPCRCARPLRAGTPAPVFAASPRPAGRPLSLGRQPHVFPSDRQGNGF
jgi:hypothetical protein